MTLKLNTPCSLGIELGAELARFVEVERGRMIAAGKAPPEPCGTCAFRKGSWANGCLQTVADALKSAVEGDVFLCHEAAGETPCAGWAILRAATPRRDEPVRLPWGYSDEPEGGTWPG